jgi:predicted nucleotidyltransferase component of viral defense system
MSGNYFIHNLYPFQDTVLKLVMEVDDSFYLTGGTALGRHYLGHRYSDDLDLFVNRNVDFNKLADAIISRIKKHYPRTQVVLSSEDFARIFIDAGKHRLKIEFVNDVLFHTGEIQVAGFFKRIDSWQNILSNKICALPRDEAKDLADLIFLSMKYSFTWQTVIGHAREKDMWVNEIEVSRMIQKADTRRLKKLNWVKEPDYDLLQKACQAIAKDIIAGGANSLAGE